MAIEIPDVGSSVDLPATACPGCGEHALRIETRLVAKPLGTYSLAGAQMKTSASPAVFLVCTACGIEDQAH